MLHRIALLAIAIGPHGMWRNLMYEHPRQSRHLRIATTSNNTTACSGFGRPFILCESIAGEPLTGRPFCPRKSRPCATLV